MPAVIGSAAVIASLLLPSPARAASTEAARGVILVSIDDLRRDRLGAYGYPRGTSPQIDAFARTATRFDLEISASGWTLPSHMSLMTSTLPSENGLVVRQAEFAGAKEPALKASVTTLAEALHAAGYATAGFVASRNLRPDVGFDRGFDVYRMRHRASAPDQIRDALAWLDRRPGARFFLFLHLYDVHSAIDAPSPDQKPFFSCGAADGSVSRASSGSVTVAIATGEEPLSSAQLAALSKAYDGCVRWTDGRLGEFFAALKTRGLFETSLIVVTSDHGENLGEWGYVSHRATLNPVLVRVPLFIKRPGQTAAEVRGDATSALDVMPTVLSEAGVEASPALRRQMGGLNLEAAPAGPRHVFAEETRRAVRAVVSADGTELVEDLGLGRAFLYDFGTLKRSGPFKLDALPAAAQPLERVLAEKYADYPGD